MQCTASVRFMYKNKRITFNTCTILIMPEMKNISVIYILWCIGCMLYIHDGFLLSMISRNSYSATWKRYTQHDDHSNGENDSIQSMYLYFDLMLLTFGLNFELRYFLEKKVLLRICNFQSILFFSLFFVLTILRQNYLRW